VKVDDPAGDTVVDGKKDPIAEGRADIARAGVLYEHDKINFAVRVQQPTDPRNDERWAGDATFHAWSVDVNADGAPDYEIQYFVDDGALGGTVSRSEKDGSDIVCKVSAPGYGSTGYWFAVDPACLGNPASVSFRVTTYYDTNPKDDNADVASDVAPNGGLSFPVPRPG
jgi:hypothetical protein